MANNLLKKKEKLMLESLINKDLITLRIRKIIILEKISHPF